MPLSRYGMDLLPLREKSTLINVCLLSLASVSF